MKSVMSRILAIVAVLATVTAMIACNSNPTVPPVTTPSASPSTGPTTASPSTGPTTAQKVEGYISLGLSVADASIPILKANNVPAAITDDVTQIVDQSKIALTAVQGGDLTSAAGVFAIAVQVQSKLEDTDLPLITNPTARTIVAVALAGLQIAVDNASNLLSGNFVAPAPSPGVAGAEANPLSTYHHKRKWGRADFTVQPCPGQAGIGLQTGGTAR